jgi:hypothetical protein
MLALLNRCEPAAYALLCTRALALLFAFKMAGICLALGSAWVWIDRGAGSLSYV